MRNLDERRAEVYRRSAERIKETEEKRQKAKKRMALISTPLALCVIFAGVYFGILIAPASSAEQNSAPEGIFKEEETELRQPEETKGAADGVIVPSNGVIDTDASGETGTPSVTDGEVVIPADSMVTSESTKEPGAITAPENTGRYGVRLETYVHLPDGMATVTLDMTKIKAATKLIYSYTNGEAGLEAWGKDTTITLPNISTTFPDSVFSLKITDNFGLSWKYEITKSSVIYVGTGKAYPITEDQFNTLVDEIGVYLP